MGKIADNSDYFWPLINNKLLQFHNLKDNWDGEGTPAPTVDLINGAVTLAKTLQLEDWARPNRVHVSVNGTIYFECRSSTGYYEIEVISPTKAEFRNNGQVMKIINM